MKKSKKKATVKSAPKKLLPDNNFDPYLVSPYTPKNHIIGHQHDLPHGWKIVACTDPTLDPKHEEIQELRDIQKLYREKSLSKMMAALDANDTLKAAWEYAFVAGYKWAQSHPESHHDQYMAFAAWARGFAHRLVLCADVTFAQGVQAYINKISLNNYVKPSKPKMKRRLHKA